MKPHSEKIPNPKELEKEIGEFLSKKFGDSVKIVSPLVVPQEDIDERGRPGPKLKPTIDFDLLPEHIREGVSAVFVKTFEDVRRICFPDKK